MPKYRAKENLFVDGSRIRAGQEFTSDLPPSKAWELIEGGKPAKPAAEKAAAKESPIPNPIDSMDEDQARALIDTKGGKQPAGGGIQAIRNAAKRASNPSGEA